MTSAPSPLFLASLRTDLRHVTSPLPTDGVTSPDQDGNMGAEVHRCCQECSVSPPHTGLPLPPLPLSSSSPQSLSSSQMKRHTQPSASSSSSSQTKHHSPPSASSQTRRRTRSWWWSGCGAARRVMLLSLTLATVTAVTVAVSSVKSEYSLHIGLPRHAHIRKVRAYSHHPELSQLTESVSSLSLVSRLQLLDLSGCHGNLSQCETMAVCDGAGDHPLCRCRRGYYFMDRQCRECRQSCPDGHFLVTPCSETADAVCTPCTACSGSQYEAAVCTTTRDTICVDVTFPVGILPMNDTQYKDDFSPISVSHSTNVFMERLVDMKELETPMYVTNNQQTQDFVWHRQSGIDIVVGISGVYLIPEYRELQVEDDSGFFQTQAMHTQDTLDKFATAKANYCRHPLPDYYYLHLEVIKNRTTVAQVVRCDSQDPTVPRCPDSYKDGDRYLDWNINKHCDKFYAKDESPEPLPLLQDALNTVVCSEETAMARDIFQVSRPMTLEMMFPSTQCSLAGQQCRQCLSSATCSSSDEDKSCCGLSCYTQGACHQFHSPQCPPAQVECASGEIHMFTLMPVFNSMSEEFKCHLQYERPAYLYNISYSLSIPSLRFQLPVQTYSATARSLLQHQRHSAAFHFIQVWHDTRLAVFDHVLLKGRHAELEATSNNHMQPFVLHSLKERAQLARKSGYFSTAKGRGQWATAVQFERPFAYSSTSWFRDGCHKNVSAIFPNQTIYRNDAVKVTAKKVDRGGNFWYQVSHDDRSPYIKLSVPEGQSVLRWFQGQMTDGTLVREELSAQLTWDADHHHWTITVNGVVKNCPAILTLQIFSKMMSACAGVYDIVVACPTNFSLAFNLSRTEGDLPDTFVLLLNDTVASHRLVLSSVLSPVSVGMASAARGQQLSQTSEGSILLWSPVLAVMLLLAVAIVVVAAVYMHIKRSASSAMHVADQQGAQPPEMAALNNQANNSSVKPPESKQQKSPFAKTCFCLFVGLYIAYSLIFTFCLALLLVYFSHQALVGDVNGVANFSSQLGRALNTSFQKVKIHEDEEEGRLFRLVDARLQACSHHLQQQNVEYLRSYQDWVTQFLIHVYQQDGAVESLAGKSSMLNTSVYSKEIEQFVVDCNRTVQSIVDRFDSHFLTHVKELTRNSWLDFPREVFLTQEGDPIDRKYMSANQLARFLHWLQADKTDDLFAISERISSRLTSLHMPSAAQHLKLSVSSPIEDFVSTLPTLPLVASHTFPVLDPPQPHPAPPLPFTSVSTDSSLSQPRADFLYGEDQPDAATGSEDVSDRGDNSHTATAAAQVQPDSSQQGVEGEEEEEGFSVVVYAMLGLFLLLDVLLFAFRMSWLVTQLRAARAGYEDRIPTDPVCQKLLAIQTGYHVNHMQDMYRSYSYSLENRENVASEERGSESEFNVYFCQSYPKSKDDILREIMAQKMNSTDQNLGQERPADPRRQRGRRGVRELPAVKELCSCCHWLHRVLISHLVWRFVVTLTAVVFLCVVVHTADFWLTPANLRVLVGGQSAYRDLHLQVHMTNHHLAGLASHLTAVLEEHTATVDSEMSLATAVFTSTLNTQRELLVELLDRVCTGAATPTCNVSSYAALPLPHLPPWQACNFLPVQPHLYQAVQAGQVDLDGLVEQQLSPLLAAVRHWLVSLCAVLMALLCVMFLCHCGATVARYYMLVWGHLPRVAIFQISENSSLMYDGGPDPHKPMQRSASWLESCESGVYVGETDLDNNPNRDV